MSEEYLYEYRQILKNTLNQVDALIYEIENFSTQSSTIVPTEIRFDAVPIVRRLKEAKKLTEESLFINKKKLQQSNEYL
ncbi:hypothetical protein DID76_03020 [Candidatus Marinamargulisbacteria bacterium SCGC AG-414-C22]|nr:hypothetical protein DID76_03020 [Candidatus Marinamargulisbacteria bacterium SCGC AG-414-C22]